MQVDLTLLLEITIALQVKIGDLNMSCDCGDNCPCKTKEKVEQEQYRGRYEVGHSNLGTSSMPIDGKLNPTSTGIPKSLVEKDKEETGDGESFINHIRMYEKHSSLVNAIALDASKIYTYPKVSGDRGTLLRVYNDLLQSCLAYKIALLEQEKGEF